MKLALKNPYLSIKEMDEIDLPHFAVLIGPNGAGKTQLLDAIQNGLVSVSGLSKSEIEKYDINTFQPGNLGVASWGSSQFGEKTAQQFFSGGESSPALIKVAEEIYIEALRKFRIDEGSEARRQFDERLRTHIRKMRDFENFSVIKNDAALSTYSRAIVEEVFQQLRPEKSNRSSSRRSDEGTCGNDSALLVSLAMKLTKKLPHELLRDDVLRATHYEGPTIGNHISQAFTSYKVGQYSWAHTQSEEREGISVKKLIEEYRQNHCPPWERLDMSLNRMREASSDSELFNFEFSNPEQDRLIFAGHGQYSFAAKFTNRATGESYSLDSLSSGEKILMSLCMAAFNQEMGRRQPGLVLFDELDALLHPSMISAFIAGLNDLFVENGVHVIMATHSVTTVSMLEDNAIFQLCRNGGRVDVQPVSKSQAVAELSENLATIDTGLRIAATDGTAPIVILTEGKNMLHLKRWADLFFPGKIQILDQLPDKTGKAQLFAYGRLLAKINLNAHFLLIWDCDAKSFAEKLSNELSGSEGVTAFAFTKRENKIARKGIENMYNENLLDEYANITTELATGREIARTMADQKKTTFASHVASSATEADFIHFGELRTTVEDILRKLGQID